VTAEVTLPVLTPLLLVASVATVAPPTGAFA